MKRRLLLTGVLAVVCVLASAPAFAQGGSSTSSISGTVLDATGGAVPGATIEAKNAGTAQTFTAVSGSQGGFNIPAVPTGVYTVTVTLSGFKTVVLSGVQVTVGQPASLQVKLEVGGLTEQVTVESSATMVQTTATSVSSTINTKQIESLPLTSRNVIDFLTFMPGVNVAGTNRQANVNGLPGSAVNITLDGVNIQDNTLKSSDGFFTIVQPRLDAIEEVTITGAASGVADAQGAISVKFVTRSGTNTYTGSGYNYYRSDKLNENTWFNIRNNVAIAKLKQNQTGARFGGPIHIPGVYDGRSRAFFFLNVENFNQPSELTRRRTILRPDVQAGNYRYNTSGGVASVNLLTLAGSNGHTNTIDPTIQQLLADIRTAASSTGSITDQTNPLFQDFNYNVLQKSNNWFPTFRVDFNLTANHRLSTVYNHDTFSTTPDAATNGFDPTFPGFPNFGSQTSERISVSNTLRSTIGRNLVNEARFAAQGAPVLFFPEQETAAAWSGPLANQKGFHLALSSLSTLTNAGPGPNAQSRNAKVYTYEDTLNWLKGNHTISGGVSVTDLRIWLQNVIPVPTVSFGLQQADPARGMFTAANFPGIAQADLTNAMNLYAVLTGRITQIAGNARISEATGSYVYGGPAVQRAQMMEVGTFVSDTWRVRPNLTLNYGVRYELQGPLSPSNSLYSFATPADVFGISGLSTTCDPMEPTADACNIFNQGQTPGSVPTYKQLTKGTKAFDTDLNNWAPSFGLNWTPTRDTGFLRTLMGEPGQFSIRAGWTRGYLRNGLNDFTAIYNANPGIRINVTKNETIGNMGAPIVLLRNDAQTGPPAFPEKPVYPLTGVVTDSINAFSPNLRTPYADTYTTGMQRGLGRTWALEVRYVGTRSRDSQVNYNLNGEVNIHENGFLQEFLNAQSNLQNNIAAGRGATFKYFGAGTNTVPLPIYLGFFSGANPANAGNAALYTSSNFTSTTFVNSMAKFNPNPFTNAGNLGGTNATAALRANGIAAGFAPNFFLTNPDKLGGATIRGNGGFTRYNSIQTEIRRRYQNGFQIQANYVYGLGYDSQRFSFRVPRLEVRQSGSGGEVTHALKGNVVFDLPFGAGRRFLTGSGPVLDRIVGGWQVNMNFRIQSGRLVDFGNVRMVGFDENDLRDMYKVRIDANKRVYMLPEDVINESIKAFSVSATSATGYGSLGAPSGRYFAPANGPDCLETIANGYGDCGTRTLIVKGPYLKEADMSLVKGVQIKGNTKAEFRIEALNVFNNRNFVPNAGVGSTNTTGYELSGLTGINTSRVVQLVTRIYW